MGSNGFSLVEVAGMDSGMFNMNGSDGDGPPGSGGVSRGRGDAAMSYKNASTTQGAEFKDKVLKPSGMDAEKSVMVSVQAATPEVDRSGAAAAGALKGAKADGGVAGGQVILPEHKAVVRQYFNRSKE